MNAFIEKPRYVCALGAFESVLAIQRAVPVLHAGPGCGSKLDGGLGTLNGSQGAGYIGPHLMPCTNIGENEVVFGGAEALTGLIEQAIAAYDADLFVVLSGCTPEIVGDDIGEVVSRFASSPKPVVFAETAGFKGSNLIGHELVMNAMIDQFLKPPDKTNPKQVNVWASVPYFHPYWAGDLQTIADLLSELGFEANVVFGPDGGVSALNKVPMAAFNLLISPWTGLGNVARLKDRFGTPFFHWPVPPVGPTETGRFIRALTRFAGIDSGAAERVISDREARYYYYVGRAADELLKTRLLPKRFFAIADSASVLAYSRFLTNDMGLVPDTLFITDNPPETRRSEIARLAREFEDGLTAKVEFVDSSGEAQRLIRERGFRGAPLIVGSGWEGTFCAEIGAHYLPLSMPLLDRMVMNRSYLGYGGALTLLEDLCSTILSEYQ